MERSSGKCAKAKANKATESSVIHSCEGEHTVDAKGKKDFTSNLYDCSDV